jgi:hypothetical protein
MRARSRRGATPECSRGFQPTEKGNRGFSVAERRLTMSLRHPYVGGNGMSLTRLGICAGDRANAPRLCLPLRVPLDTSGLQARRMKRLVGRLCQTPGRWDAATPGAFHFLAHAHRSLSIGGRSGCLGLTSVALARISHTRSTAACPFPSWRRYACSLLGQDVPIQPFVPRGARLATPGNSRASSRNV